MKAIFGNRSTGDLMVLMIAGTVCFSVLASGALVAVLSLFRPETDVTLWVQRVTAIVNTLIGLLAGFLAGRTDVTIRAKLDTDEDEDGKKP